MNYLEKKIRKYVIANLERPTGYLVSLHEGKWAITQDISAATKTLSKNVARRLISYYRSDTGNVDDFVVVPIDISYELVCDDLL